MTDFVDPHRNWKWEAAGFLIAMGIVATCVFGAMKLANRSPIRLDPPRRVVLADSLGRARALDSARLVEYGRKLANSRGDSLAALLAHRAVVLRTRWRVDTLVQADTVRDSVIVASSDVRTILLADSACVVRADSMGGEIVQREYDLRECVAALASAPRANRWTIGAGIIGDVDGIRPTATVGRRWGAFEVEGGAVVDRSRPGVIASARWAF